MMVNARSKPVFVRVILVVLWSVQSMERLISQVWPVLATSAKRNLVLVTLLGSQESCPGSKATWVKMSFLFSNHFKMHLALNKIQTRGHGPRFNPLLKIFSISQELFSNSFMAVFKSEKGSQWRPAKKLRV